MIQKTLACPLRFIKDPNFYTYDQEFYFFYLSGKISLFQILIILPNILILEFGISVSHFSGLLKSDS